MAPHDDDVVEQPRTHQAVGRRAVLAGGVLGAVATAVSSVGGASPARAATGLLTGAGATTSSGTLPVELAALLTAWAASPSNHPVLGDWRRTGYRRGAQKPTASGRPVVTAQSIGIRPDQGGDVSAALQTALDEIGSTGGGVLKLGAGRYVLDNPVFVHGSNVVLQGAGVGKTTLHFTRTLEQSIGSVRDFTGQSAWSWTGGQVFFISRERLAASRAANWRAEEGKGTEGWLPGERLATVSPAQRGTDVLMVDDTSAITPGDMVLLEIDNLPDRRLLRELAGDVPGASTYDWSTRARRISARVVIDDFATWSWPVIVTEVLTPRTVRIEQPLRVTIHRETPARLRSLGPTVHDSGVEDLTIENALLPQTAHNQNPGSNGVCFQAVHDCWAKNIRVVNADLAFGMTAAKSCTLSGISYGGRALHHFVACRVLSHDNLIEDFLLEEPTIPAVAGSFMHGINVEGLASGNVYRRGDMRVGTFDSHRALPFENLRTNITINNRNAIPGGATDAGPFFGARTVHWGIDVMNGNNLCMDITDIAPRSLTAGITGLASPGSILPRIGQDFAGDLETERLAFGTELGRGRDLLDLQRDAAPLP